MERWCSHILYLSEGREADGLLRISPSLIYSLFPPLMLLPLQKKDADSSDCQKTAGIVICVGFSFISASFTCLKKLKDVSLEELWHQYSLPIFNICSCFHRIRNLWSKTQIFLKTNMQLREFYYIRNSTIIYGQCLQWCFLPEVSDKTYWMDSIRVRCIRQYAAGFSDANIC